MTDLEDRLREALRPQAPPAGFTDRVLQRAAQRQETVLRPSPAVFVLKRPVVRWAAAAAIVAAVAGGIQYRTLEKARAERTAGEAAKEQVIKALRLTSSKLQIVQAKVMEVGS